MTVASVMSNLVALLLLLWLTNVAARGRGPSYVQEACSVTQYRELCVRSLASFSGSAKRSPSRWARAGVSVSLSEVKNAGRYLEKVYTSRSLRGRNRAALSDCLECFQDAVDNLHKSLGLLRMLTRNDFNDRMSDLLTWMSAALTDEDTCLDGFEGQTGGRAVRAIHNRVQRVTYYTSNALALANKLASTGEPA
ncbi:pectinesterase inhibitor 6 [Eucalyptus grandis]|uniref:pectinesterase inhibitor 6 n=1 Tax=Eucalyptus grandis TaxID=71139 RepID=UPI00192EBEC5|nr:pectinesterase inhibitor 6 [Eucalyptus grandis]